MGFFITVISVDQVHFSGPITKTYGGHYRCRINSPGQQKWISESEFFGGKGIIFVFLRHFGTKHSSRRKHRNSQHWDKAQKSFSPQQQQQQKKRFLWLPPETSSTSSHSKNPSDWWANKYGGKRHTRASKAELRNHSEKGGRPNVRFGKGERVSEAGTDN